MRHGSLFSGIGGFDLAAEWMGWENVFHCEWNDFGQRVLNYYWPNAASYGDITKTDFTIHRGGIDILTGGFPCQPYSTAGKRKGKYDQRHLWPEMLRCIRECQPRWVVGENVYGLVNWNGGMVFDEVCADLEGEGYEVQPVIIPACAVDAPHRRDRVWFVAHATDRAAGSSRQGGGTKGERGYNADFTEGGRQQAELNHGCGQLLRLVAHSNRIGSPAGRGEVQGAHEEVSQWDNNAEPCNAGYEPAADTAGPGGREIKRERERESNVFDKIGAPRTWQHFPTQPPVRGRTYGVSADMVRLIMPEVYAKISEANTAEDLQKVREAFWSQEIRQQIGGLYKIHESGILLEIVQLCSSANQHQEGVSPWSEKASEGILRKMRKYGSLANTPQGRELGKQFSKQFRDTLPKLSHEIALVAMEAERETQKFKAWHRNESIKAYGNAIVPQVVYEIFKVIERMEHE